MAETIRDLNRSVSLDSGGNDFIKLAKCLGEASLGGHIERGLKMATEIGSGRVREVIERGAIIGKKGAITIGAKAAVPPLGLSDPLAWYRPLAEGFFASMAEFSCLSRINNAGDWHAVPPRTQMATLTTAPVGDSSSEFFAKAFSSGTFKSDKLEPQKTTSMVALKPPLVSTTPISFMRERNGLGVGTSNSRWRRLLPRSGMCGQAGSGRWSTTTMM